MQPRLKYDRLRLLWRVTLVVSVLVGWVLLNVAMLQRVDVSRMIIPLIIIAVGTLLTRTLLMRGDYRLRPGSMSSRGCSRWASRWLLAEAQLLTLLPFAFPVLIFIVGLLLQPGNTVFTGCWSAR